uniref:Uncharacterized protein n=1 Tax=Rhizophora mucronata TaxID=61149 RepID=A0A2P2N1A5_RHIMU
MRQRPKSTQKTFQSCKFYLKRNQPQEQNTK